MEFVDYDVTNPAHVKSFKYFAYTAGHPQCRSKKRKDSGDVGEIDIEFRDDVCKALDLEYDDFVEDCSGSSHAIVGRLSEIDPKNLTVVAEFCYGEDDVVYAKASGILRIASYDNGALEAVWEYNPKTIERIDESEFAAAFKQREDQD